MVDKMIKFKINEKVYVGNLITDDKNKRQIGRIVAFTEYFNGEIEYGVELEKRIDQQRYLGEMEIISIKERNIIKIDSFENDNLVTIFDQNMFKFELGFWVKHKVDRNWIGLVYGRTLDSNNNARYKVRIKNGIVVDEYELMWERCADPDLNNKQE